MDSQELTDKIQEIKNPLVVFCFGTLIGATFYFKEISLLYLIILSTLIFVLFLFKRNQKILLMIVSVLIGYFYCVLYFKYFMANLDKKTDQKAIFIGEIQSNADRNSQFNKKYFFKIKNIIDENGNKEEINSSVQVIGSHYEEYDMGDVVQLTGKLGKPKGAILPGLYDEKKYLLSKGVHYVLEADPGALVFLDSPINTLYIRKINNLRENFILTNKNNLPYEEQAIVNSIVLGSKASELPDDLKDKIRSLGLSHITSASGFNVSVLAVGIFYLFRLFAKSTILPTIVSIIAVLFYSSLADFSASIIRATIFIVFILVGNLFDKKPKILPSISLILLLFFYFNPVNVLDVGLQLSILAFLGIVLYSSNVFLQSLFAQIMVVPLIVFYFHNIQALGLISNIVAVPISAFILIMGLLSFLFFLIPGFQIINAAFSLILKILSYLFLSWVYLLDKISVKQFFLPNLNFYFLIAIYAFLLFFLSSLYIKQLREKYKITAVIFLLTFTLICIFTDTSRYLKIFCLARYNNDSVLVIPPRENAVLISSKLDHSSHRALVDFLRLNNISSDYNFYYLNEVNKHKSSFVKNEENKISVNYNDFSFDILKNYDFKVTSAADYLKLPILMKKDPDFKLMFEKLPKNIIINDYKRLSKKSIGNINWLKTQPVMAYFLSHSGTIALISDGKSCKVDFMMD